MWCTHTHKRRDYREKIYIPRKKKRENESERERIKSSGRPLWPGNDDGVKAGTTVTHDPSSAWFWGQSRGPNSCSGLHMFFFSFLWSFHTFFRGDTLMRNFKRKVEIFYRLRIASPPFPPSFFLCSLFWVFLVLESNYNTNENW